MRNDIKNVIIALLVTVILAITQPGTVLIKEIDTVSLLIICVFEFLALTCAFCYVDEVIMRINVELKKRKLRCRHNRKLKGKEI